MGTGRPTKDAVHALGHGATVHAFQGPQLQCGFGASVCLRQHAHHGGPIRKRVCHGYGGTAWDKAG